MSESQLVYIPSRALTLNPPGKSTYHEFGYARFPRYVPDPENPGLLSMIPIGQEIAKTACHRTIYTIDNDPRFASPTNKSGYHYDGRMTAVRRDIAALFASPCVACARRNRR